VVMDIHTYVQVGTKKMRKREGWVPCGWTNGGRVLRLGILVSGVTSVRVR
jgi:hypothetical protein